MMEGIRKLVMLWSTLGATLVVVLVALFKGVHFTGDNISSITNMLLLFGGLMAGANFGEHWAKSRAKGAKQ